MRMYITNIVGALCAVAMVGSANAAIKEEAVTYMDGAMTMRASSYTTIQPKPSGPGS